MENTNKTNGKDRKACSDVATETLTKYKIGKVFDVDTFLGKGERKLTCRRCRAQLNLFFRFHLGNESIKWDCQNCSNDWHVIALEHGNPVGVNGEEISWIVSIYKRQGDLIVKKFGLIDNMDFREVEEVVE